MKETTENIHIEALHYLSGVPFNPEIGLRANKVNILESLGFSKGKNVSMQREFQASQENGICGLHGYLLQQMQNGRFVSMLFNGMGWESSGGSPVVYIMSEDDIDNKLAFEDKKLIKVNSQEGNKFNVDDRVRLQTYSRLKSKEISLNGFDNYEKEIKVRAGGGFRLQLDNIAVSNGETSFTFSSYFSFNDMGSRVLALSSTEDRKVPCYSKSFKVKIKDGLMIFSSANEVKASKLEKVDDLSNVLLEELFNTDGTAISLLYRYLLSVRPSLETHQLEGIFSVTDKYGISMEVIDFDGIDSFDLGNRSPRLGPSERLTSAHLRMAGYALTDSQRLLSYVEYTKRIKVGLDGIIKSDLVPSPIKDIVQKIVVPNSEKIFGEDIFGAFKLAQVLRSVGIISEKTDIQDINVVSVSGGQIFFILIEGFDMAFLQTDGKIIDCTDIKKQRDTLSKILNIDIIDAHFSYMREGD